MESDAIPVDVNMVESILVGSLMDKFSDPADPVRARFPQLRQHANMHREARTHTVTPFSSPIPVHGHTRTTLFLPNSLTLLPAWIACFLESHSTPARAVVPDERTSTRTPPTPSSQL
eukprot:259776-Pleurochrysis_carterae.AAC.1